MGSVYEASPGENIHHAAIEMVKLAKQTHSAVECVFNDVRLVAIEGTTAGEIESVYHKALRRGRKKYENSPQGRASAKAAEEYRARAAVHESKGVLPFKVLAGKEGDWATCVQNNSDPYGACTVRYAARWANYMEAAMEKGEKIAQCADRTSHEADKEGITGFMYGCAVSILAACWLHGEALRLWHNLKTQLKDEGTKANKSGGVLNPALLSIGGQ